MHHCVTVGYEFRRRTRKEPFGRKVSADAQRVELSGPPAVIAKYIGAHEILVPPRRHRPCEADLHRREAKSRQATWEGHLMWLINLSIAIAAWIAVCAAIIKLVEALP